MYLKVTYKTSELTGSEYLYGNGTVEKEYLFPGIRGIINPPTPIPVPKIPMARPRFFSNQFTITMLVGITPVEAPPIPTTK
jgi:hypothetical protein